MLEKNWFVQHAKVFIVLLFGNTRSRLKIIIETTPHIPVQSFLEAIHSVAQTCTHEKS